MIEWTHTVVKDKTPGQSPGERVATVDWWEGRVGLMRDAVTIQGPTKRNRSYRVMTVLRWKDAATHDAPTLNDAQVWAEREVNAWLDRSGLALAGK